MKSCHYCMINLICLLNAVLTFPVLLNYRHYCSERHYPGQTDDIVILVHGLLSTHETYNEFASILDRNFDLLGLNENIIVGVDCLGHGDSPFVETLDYVNGAASLRVTVEHILRSFDNDVQRKVHLVGHSSGGKLCAVACLQDPELYASVTLLDVMPASFPNDCWSPIRQTIRMLESIPISQLHSRDSLKAHLQHLRMSNKMKDFLASNTKLVSSDLEGEGNTIEGQQQYLKWRFDIRAIVECMEDIEGFPDIDKLRNRNYNNNALLIRANPKKSFYVKDNELRNLYALFPGVEIITVGQAQEDSPGGGVAVGHWLHSDAPQEVAKIVAGFISCITRKRDNI